MTTALTADPVVERVKAVNHHLRTALDQVSDAVFIVQGEPDQERGFLVVYGNRAASQWAGVKPAELPGAELWSFVTPEARAAISAAVDVGAEECEIMPASGSATGGRARRCGIREICDEDGIVLNRILTLSEIADAPGAAAEPAPSSPDLSAPPPTPAAWHDDVIETIRETARHVAHEFNNALTAIVLPVQMAIRATPMDGQLRESLQTAHESAARAAELARDFLDCFRPRPAVRELTSPAGFLGRSMRLASCAQNIAASFEVPEDLHDVEVDESQLERVIFNLIRNASQAMPNGGRLRVAAANMEIRDMPEIGLPDGPYVRIAVRDWGPGIPDEHLRHLFHSRFTTKPDGNGCGLPICYQIIKDHGGEMHVRTKLNVGTEFILFLPAAAAAADNLGEEPADSNPNAADTPRILAMDSGITATVPVPAPAAAVDTDDTEATPPSAGVFPATATVPVPVASAATAPVTAPVLPPLPVSSATAAVAAPAVTATVPVGSAEISLSLLVVDDEQIVRQALSQIARHMGFEASTVGTSEEALQAYKDRLHAGRPYSCVLLDLNLRSGLNGLEVFQAMRRMDPEALVVATSGQHEEGDVARFRALGFAGFLPKPYSLEQFDKVLRDALAE